LDRLQHILWEDIRGGDYRIADKTEEYLMKMDSLIGEITEQLHEDTLLLICSDHGFTTFKKSFSVNTWLWKNGYMGLVRYPSKDNYGEIFNFVDWSKTRAYTVGFSGIYLNLIGRERDGTVNLSSAQSLKESLIKGLEEFKDPINRERVVKKVYLREEIYKGNHVENAPDLVIGFMPGYRMSWQSAIGGLTPEIVFPNRKRWKADHLVDPEFVPGVLFSNKKMLADQADITDIAPTIIKFMGLEVSGNMDGRPLL
jgi:predicted AlkP superfamily phosphohydrolase/phosphomutase